MPQLRPVMFIEDDPGDIRIFRMAMNVLNVSAPIHCVSSAKDAVDHLLNADALPGLILCNSRLASVSGTDIRETIAAEPQLQRMTIPVVFLGTAADEAAISKAFRLPVQGFFQRETSFERYLDQLDRILRYWSASITPDTPAAARGWR